MQTAQQTHNMLVGNQTYGYESAKPMATVPKDIADQMMTLDGLVKSHLDLVSELHQALNPVMTPAMPTEQCVGGVSPNDPRSPFAIELQQLSRRIQQANASLRDALGRIQL